RRYDFLQLCFTVADLDAFLRHLRDRNVTALHPPQRFEHTSFVTLLDPEGRHVRAMTPWRRPAPSESGVSGGCTPGGRLRTSPESQRRRSSSRAWRLATMPAASFFCSSTSWL